jgi:hypothetical protein
MDLITFVTDRSSNFVKGLRSFKVLYCVAHRLNNILKTTFYQQPKRVSVFSLFLSLTHTHPHSQISMTIVQQLIEFLQSWKYVLCEVQKGSSPSLFAVLPCIAFLKADLVNRENKEKQGIDINVVGFCF